MVVTLGQINSIMSGRNPPLYCTALITFINRHAGTPNKTKTKDTMRLAWITTQFVTLGLVSDGCRRRKYTSSHGCSYYTRCSSSSSWALSLSVENEQAGAGRNGRTRLARPNSQARTGTEKCSFSLFS